jgi:hypothetical protein
MLVIIVAMHGTNNIKNVLMRFQERCIHVLVGKPEGRRPLERSRHRWENNIKMDLQEVGWGDMDWIDLAVMNLQVP